jgi:hypothetical protein
MACHWHPDGVPNAASPTGRAAVVPSTMQERVLTPSELRAVQVITCSDSVTKHSLARPDRSSEDRQMAASDRNYQSVAAAHRAHVPKIP